MELIIMPLSFQNITVLVSNTVTSRTVRAMSIDRDNSKFVA
jgi:hypothetical protein